MSTAPPPSSLGRQVHQTYLALKRRLESNLAQEGLTLSEEQFRLLMHLLREEGSTQAELARRLDTNKTALTRLLDELQTQGLVERRTDRKDRRAKRVFLSAEGRGLRERLERAARHTSEEAQSGMNRGDQERLFAQLQQIRDRLAP